MIVAYPIIGPVGAALCQVARSAVDIVLHLGAHRTGSTSFQAYMRDNSAELANWGIGFWGPHRIRKGMFAGIMPRPGFGAAASQLNRAKGRISLQVAQAEARGRHTLIVSEENMMGSIRDNLRTGSLYPAVGERMARYAAAMTGRASKIMLSVRSLDHHWSSVASFAVARGQPMPRSDHWGRIATARRSWRDVIADLACAVPDAEIRVFPFECFAGRPSDMLAAGADCYAPAAAGQSWLNRSPSLPKLRHVLRERGDRFGDLPTGEGRWSPFDARQTAALRELYAEDMHWLYAGADGLATLIEDPARTQENKMGVPQMTGNRGRPNAIKERAMARPG